MRRRKRNRGRTVLYAVGFGCWIGIFLLCLPPELFDVPYSPVLFAEDGTLLGASVASDGQWRFPPGGPVPEKFARALIAFEDQRFYLHPGVDPLAAARAARDNLASGRVVSGGSTITMQVVRLHRGKKRRTLAEKGAEAFLALRLDLLASKRRILELYAANAPFGGNVVGLEAASWRWFARSPESLSWAEAATLAVLPNGPGLIHPGRNRSVLLAKRDRLLRTLAADGAFDGATLDLALREGLPPEPYPLPRLAPHLLARAVAEGAPPRIRTTLDPGIQARAAVLLDRRVEELERNGVANAACLVLRTRTGEVLAYVGNASAEDGPGRSVDLVVAPRSSGSLFKPFLYAFMLDSGELLPRELLSDVPTRIGSYGPENNTRTYLGAVPADQALARSLNVPAVRCLREYGVARFAAGLRSVGVSTLFRSPEEYGLPLVLGGAETTLWDMAGAYAGLSRTALLMPGRTFFPPRYRSEHGTPSARGAGSAPPVSVGAARLTLEALAFVARPGEEAAWQDFASARRIAWKTGTSFGFRDAWAVGTTPEYTVAVWAGNASGEGRAELRGSTCAAPLLFELFSSLPPGSWYPDAGTSLRRVVACAASGLPAGPDCGGTVDSFVPVGAPDRVPCRFCRSVALTSGGKALADPREESVVERRFVLPPVEEWYYRKWNLDYRPLPPPSGAYADAGLERISLASPEEGAEIYVPVELDGGAGMLVAKAAVRDPGATVHWHLDEEYLGSTSGVHEMAFRPRPGRRVLVVVDGKGASATRRFVVLGSPSAR